MLAVLTAEPVWRFLPEGERRHLLTPGSAVAACGHRPWAPWEWLGASQAQAAEMAKLPHCRSCVRMSGCQHVACRTRREVEMPWSWRQAS